MLLAKKQQMSITDTHTKQINSDIFSLTFFQRLSAAVWEPRLPPSHLAHTHTKTQLLHASDDVEDYKPPSDMKYITSLASSDGFICIMALLRHDRTFTGWSHGARAVAEEAVSQLEES